MFISVGYFIITNDWTRRTQHVNFTYKREDPLPVRINHQTVPYANTAKYLGMTLDAKLRWKEHIKVKRLQLDILRRKMNWLLGRNSQLSVHDKLILYKQTFKPVWMYDIQLWGCSRDSNTHIIQVLQNQVLRGTKKNSRIQEASTTAFKSQKQASLTSASHSRRREKTKKNETIRSDDMNVVSNTWQTDYTCDYCWLSLPSVTGTKYSDHWPGT